MAANVTFVLVVSTADCVTRGKNPSEYFIIGDQLVFIFNCYALPLIALFGTIGNVLSLVVLLQPQMRKSSMNIALIGLTSSDLFFVVSTFFMRAVGQQWVGFLKDVNLTQTLRWWINAISYPSAVTGNLYTHPVETNIDNHGKMFKAGTVPTISQF